MHIPRTTGRVALAAIALTVAATNGGAAGGATSAQAASTVSSPTSGAVALGADTAGADTAGAVATDADSAGSTGFSCWLEVDTGATLCVEEGVDLISAVALETGVVLEVPDGVTIGGPPSRAEAVRGAGSTAHGKAGAGAVARASTVISTIYADASYGGASYTMSTSTGSCSYGYANLTALGWHDRASSFRSFNGCTTALFENENYTGTRVGYATNASSLGAMNDKADSWRAQ